MNLRADGLTPLTQGSSQKSWWNGAFTRLLSDAIPLQTELVVELECGHAAAAHTLLPSLPSARYVGVDSVPERLAEGKADMDGARVASRMELRLASPLTLPLEDASCDVVLDIMSLQHIPQVPGVLAEAMRVLRPGGRIVAVEPDNLGQRFYFDGVLEEINDVFHSLCLKARVERQPADIALGPRLPSLLRDAGFHGIEMMGHMVSSNRMEPASAFFSRLSRVAATIAREAGLPESCEQLQACEQAINRCQFAGIPKRVGFSSHAVPVFRCAGRKS
jgi:SAM-dependent methyltransferase